MVMARGVLGSRFTRRRLESRPPAPAGAVAPLDDVGLAGVATLIPLPCSPDLSPDPSLSPPLILWCSRPGQASDQGVGRARPAVDAQDGFCVWFKRGPYAEAIHVCTVRTGHRGRRQ